MQNVYSLGFRFSVYTYEISMPTNSQGAVICFFFSLYRYTCINIREQREKFPLVTSNSIEKSIYIDLTI